MACAALALTMLVGASPLLRRCLDGQLAVVNAADEEVEIMPENQQIVVAWGKTGKITPEHTPNATLMKINLYSGKNILTIYPGVTLDMQYTNSNNSQIDLDRGSILHLKGKITGRFYEISIPRPLNLTEGAHFYVYLDEGAVFDATYESDKNADYLGGSSHPIECIGCNVSSNKYGSVTVTSADRPSVNLLVQDNNYNTDGTPIVSGTFNKDTAGTVYTVAPTEESEYEKIVWTKGPGGAKLDPTYPINDNITFDGDNLIIPCGENAKYPVYAVFIPKPTWDWTDPTNPIVTVYSYDANAEDGVLATTYGTNNGVTVTTEGNTITATFSDGDIETNSTYDTSTHEDEEECIHVWNAGVVTTPATCKTAGTKTFTCTKCGATKTEDIPIDPNAHRWGAWYNVTKQPTTTEDGIGSRKCELCGKTETGVTIPKGTVISNTGDGNNGNNSADPASPAYPYYVVSSKSESSWAQGSSSGLVVTIQKTGEEDKRIVNDLVSVWVDNGKILSDPGDYTAVEGSIKITLDPKYLKTLSVGPHTLNANLINGKTLTWPFVITSASGNGTGNGNSTGNGTDDGKGSDSPKTSDDNYSLLLFVWLFVISASAAFALFYYKKHMKKQMARAYR